MTASSRKIQKSKIAGPTWQVQTAKARFKRGFPASQN